MTSASTKGSHRITRLSGTGCLVIFGLFWSALTLVADAAIGWNVVRQLHALTFSTTMGTVTLSQVKTVEGEDGATYRPRIAYTYSVGGREYASDRYRYGEWSAAKARADEIVASHPAQSRIKVYYRASDPSDAVLKAGLEGMDLFLGMFMLPFNAVMAAFWAAGGGAAFRSLVPSPTGGAKVREDGYYVRVDLSSISPVFSGAAISGALAFVMTFIVGLGFGGSPPRPVMLLVWAMILAGGTWGYLCHHSKSARGDFDLVLDSLSQSITLPPTLGRTTIVKVPARKVTSVVVEEIAKRGSKGSTYPVYAPTVVFTDEDGSTRRERLVEWSDADRAETLAGWLGERIGIKST